MKTLLYPAKGAELTFNEFSDPEPAEGEVVVDLRAAALNHRDVYIMQGLYPGVVTPIILGSDVAGVYAGREVIINPSLKWGEDPRAQSRDYEVLGMPHHGTFAQKIAVPEDHLFDKPPHLRWEQAAALPLAGLTAYRALFTKGECKAGKKVFITGIGGGVALMALQFALAVGAEAYVSSGSPEKLEKAQKLGATNGVNYREEDWNKQLKKMAGGFDLIIDSAGGKGFARLPKLCNPAARIVVYGGTQGPVPNFSPQSFFWKQISILGSTMGNDQEFADMVKFVNTQQIVPVVDATYDLHEAAGAFARLDAGLQFGKITFRIPE